MFAAPSSTTTFIKPSLLLNKTTPKNSSSKRKHLFRTKIMAKGSSSYLAPDTYHSMSPSDEELIFLHCMLRSSNLEKTMSFFQALGLKETRRKDSEKGKFTLVFMATSPGAPEIEITYNWGDEEEVFGTRFFFPYLYTILIFLQPNSAAVAVDGASRLCDGGHLCVVQGIARERNCDFTTA